MSPPIVPTRMTPVTPPPPTIDARTLYVKWAAGEVVVVRLVPDKTDGRGLAYVLGHYPLVAAVSTPHGLPPKPEDATHVYFFWGELGTTFFVPGAYSWFSAINNVNRDEVYVFDDVADALKWVEQKGHRWARTTPIPF